MSGGISLSIILVAILYFIRASLNLNWIILSVIGIVFVFVVYSLILKIFRDNIPASFVITLVMTILLIYGINSFIL